jgi:hypothetical protein
MELGAPPIAKILCTFLHPQGVFYVSNCTPKPFFMSQIAPPSAVLEAKISLPTCIFFRFPMKKLHLPLCKNCKHK